MPALGGTEEGEMRGRTELRRLGWATMARERESKAERAW